MIYKILCKFCQKELGYFDVLEGTNPLDEVEDSRCDDCEKEYGKYKVV